MEVVAVAGCQGKESSRQREFYTERIKKMKVFFLATINSRRVQEAIFTAVKKFERWLDANSIKEKVKSVWLSLHQCSYNGGTIARRDGESGELDCVALRLSPQSTPTPCYSRLRGGKDCD